MVTRFLSAMALTCVTAMPLMAAGTLYDCTITQKGTGVDWVPNKLGIVLQPNGQAVVSDSVILHFEGRPIEAVQVRNRSARLDVRWTLYGVRDSQNQLITMDYHARINKENGVVRMHVKPDGYLNQFTGKGACVTKSAS